MNSKSNHQIRKFFYILLLLGMILSLFLGMSGSLVAQARGAGSQTHSGLETEIPRQGGWLDEIDFSVVDANSAVVQIQAGTLDVYAYPLGSAQLSAIQAAGLNYATTFGTFYDIMYNPAVCTNGAVLNPFSDRKIREATNRLYDRNYINTTIYSGGGQPKFFAISTNGPDYAALVDVASSLQTSYAFNENKAIADIATEMTALGATLVSGKWQYAGSPVTLTFLIRNDGDGTRMPMGSYVADQLEKAGFTVDRQYKKSSEASPIWIGTDPATCQWNLYTAGWGSNFQRDEKGIFQEMYLPDSPDGYPYTSANVPDPVFQQVGDDLANSNFTTASQRHNLMTQAMSLSLQDSLQVWIIDTRSYAPYDTDVKIIANAASGVENSPISMYTARFAGLEGGTLKWGETNLFSDPWNPVQGNTWVWDTDASAATSGAAFMSDPYTGLQWPLRAESAALTVQTGLPVYKTLDWITLSTADTIDVPADAWVDWNASTQTFITAGTGRTARIKSVITYPADMFTTVTWHDGSPLSVADFVMKMIMTFDRAKPDSAIYDSSSVDAYNSFISSFKGVKIVSTSPLVIETYSDSYQSDAELDITSWWPNYGFSEAPWDAIAIANMAEAAGELAYSTSKASNLAINKTSFISGPSLPILVSHLNTANTEKTIPYAPTMGAYVSADDAYARYNALRGWVKDLGHFWVGTGPYYLESVNVGAKTLVLKNYPFFPDRSDRWSNFFDTTIPPNVNSIIRKDASPTLASTVRFTVTFSKPVTGVDISDFSLATSGLTGASLTGVSSGNTTYTVTVNTGTGTGTIGLNLADNDSIIDSSGNPLGGTGAGNGDFTGEVYTIDKGASDPPSVPALLSPDDGATLDQVTPLLDWSDSTLPASVIFDHYQLQVATDGAFSTIVRDVNISGITNSSHTTSVPGNSSLFWRVRAFNAYGNSSDWSLVRSFTTPYRTGGWLDEIDFSVVDANSAVAQLQAGTLDVYASPLGSGQFPAIQAAGLNYAASYGVYYAIMYNPAVCTNSSVLNPFNDRKIREATNRLYDRNYINTEIYGGGSLPKLFTIQTIGPDYAALADVASALEAKYAFNESKAIADIATEMTVRGATLVSGKWQYAGSPVTLIFLIRNDGDGTRMPMGSYVADQLEKAGFTVDRQYKKSSELSPIWIGTDPATCQWNLYTAGWIDGVLVRDNKGAFQQMYLPDSPYGYPYTSANVPDPVFQQVGDDLANANFSTYSQRHNLMTQAMSLSLQDSLQVWIIDTKGYAPYDTDVMVAANTATGIEASPISMYTARFTGSEGGVLKWGEVALFTESWNPVAGNMWQWEQSANTATSGAAFMGDPYTGLQWPLRAESAALTVQTGLPVYKTLDWITLSTADTIDVPADAWVDWNASTQTFITAGTGRTARIKSVITYPADMFTAVTWHDGSPLSVADFVMKMIMTFDRAKPDSAIYDSSSVDAYNSFISSFKGVKIVSTSPLVIETYSDSYQSDAELDITSWWPNYGFSEAPWDAIALANQAEVAGEIAYSAEKASNLSIEKTSFISGPSLPILVSHLNDAIVSKTIPYSPTMSAYVTADDAYARYDALGNWVKSLGHFWVGTGPYYLESVNVGAKTLVLKNYPFFPDRSDRWSGFYAYNPEVIINYSSGAPGSYFTITGSGFPPDKTAMITINGHELGTVPTDSSGGFVFTLETNPTAEEGFYWVTVSVDPYVATLALSSSGSPSAKTLFILDSAELVQARVGTDPLISVPDEIGVLHSIFLPLVRR